MDPLLKHYIAIFLERLIPMWFIENFPAALTAMLVTVIPYTPMDAITFSLLFVIIYFTNIFGLAGATTYTCKFNKLNEKKSTSVVAALRNTYAIYFPIMLLINYITVADRKSLLMPAGLFTNGVAPPAMLGAPAPMPAGMAMPGPGIRA